MKEHVRQTTGYYAKNKQVTDYTKAIKGVDNQIDLLEHLIFGHRI